MLARLMAEEFGEDGDGEWDGEGGKRVLEMGEEGGIVGMGEGEVPFVMADDVGKAIESRMLGVVKERTPVPVTPEEADMLGTHLEIEAAKVDVLANLHHTMLTDPVPFLLDQDEGEGGDGDGDGDQDGGGIDTTGMSQFKIEMLRKQGLL